MRQYFWLFLLLGATVTEGAGPSVNDTTYWKDYRGPGRSGHYTETKILTEWPSGGLPLVWKTEVGLGYSGITVAAGKVFTIEQRGKYETMAAYEIGTGREIWSVQWPGRYSSFVGGKGPRSTPVWDDGRIYAQGALGELKCIEAASGRQIWSRNILTDSGARNVRWGTSASPLVMGDLLITSPGGPDGNSVVAYRKVTGERAWSALDDRPSYASPMPATLARVEQILVVNASGVAGLAPDDGKLLWRYGWKTSYDVNAAQPVLVGENRFLISSGYGHGSALVEISGGPDEYEATTIWENKFLKNKFNTSVLYKGHIYGLDEGILVCLAVESGERIWKGGRYGYGQILLAGDHLVISAATGEVALVRATPEGHQEVSRFQAVEGKMWNTPALAGGFLFVRSQTQMASYRIAP